MIAVEILSSGEDIERKITLYFAEGALEGSVYRRDNGQVVRTAVGSSYKSEAAQVTVTLADIF